MMLHGLRRVLLHGGADESFDAALRFARRLVDGFGAELHVVYTVAEPLSAGWTAEMSAAKLPELHQAIEAEARERLAHVLGSAQDTTIIAIRTGDAAEELVRYTAEHTVDLAIVQGYDDHAKALLDRGRCSVLALR
jgi:nucleotide-binding universal stress UspA family protein